VLRGLKLWLKFNNNGFKELLGKRSVNIKKVGNVILAVNDLDKSLQFYHEIIGLPIKNQRRSWIDLGTSGALLSLHPASLTDQHIGGSIEKGDSKKLSKFCN